MNLLTCLLIFSVCTSVKCAKILGVFPSAGYSQFILCEKLMTELARRGHEVTVISSYKPNEDVKNYKTILIDGLIEQTEGDMFLLEDKNIITNIIEFHKLGYLLTEFILSHQKVQKLIHSNETFELVVVEQFGNEAHMAFAQHFNALLVLFSSIGLSEWNSHLMGNVRLPSIEPISFSQFTNHMTFCQRLSNSVFTLFDTMYKKWIAFPHHQEFVDKYFPKKMCLKDIMYNGSLMLLNSHASTTHPTSLAASIIEIGGFHIQPKKLPKDLQQFLDEAENGAIFFSMGSNLNTSNLPNGTLHAILTVFSKMNQRVLWKFDDTNIPNKPKNLLISKWLPQSDILAHPKMVAFLSHGGLLSTTEAVFHGVPMVGVPIFGDQKMNVARLVEKGVAVHLSFKQLSEDALSAALNEILNNPKYRVNAKKNSYVLRDQLVPPLDVAMYWIEYVIRHGGAPHFKIASMGLHWFQLYLIDVISFVIVLTVIIYCFVRLLLGQIYAIIISNSKGVVTRSAKQKIN